MTPEQRNRLDARIDSALPDYRSGARRSAPTGDEFLRLLDMFADEVADRVAELLATR